MLKNTYLESVLFVACLLLGIFTAYRVNFISAKSYLVEMSLINFYLIFILLTFLLLSLTIFKKVRKMKKGFYKTLFVLAILGGGTYVLNVWMIPFGSLLMIFLVLAWFLIPMVSIHNVVIILGIAGAGSIIGSGFTPQGVIILLMIFSLYDFIAVYKTKHMVKMAEDMIESRAVLGLIVPMELSGFWEHLDEVKPGGKFYILGGGDVAFPMILAISVLPFGLINSLIISFFSLMGLLFTFLIFTSEKEALPALPPIALFSIIGYIVSNLLFM